MTRPTLACAALALVLAACGRQQADMPPPKPPAPKAAAPATPDPTDAYLMALAQADLYEVQAGGLAVKMGAAQGVKDLGRMMVTEHAAMATELKAMTDALGKSAPAVLDQRRTALVEALKAAPAADFDRLFLEQQETEHAEELALVNAYAAAGVNPTVKDAAVKAVPRVQMHADKVAQVKTIIASAPPAATPTPDN